MNAVFTALLFGLSQQKRNRLRPLLKTRMSARLNLRVDQSLTMRTKTEKSVITSVLIAGLILSHSVVARDKTNLIGAEAEAISVAVEAFKKIYAKPALRHYTVQLARRRKNELEITFVADNPEKVDSGHPGTVGGGTIYGPDMTYVVSLKTFKILRYNFYR
jgi:hypothetical protein